MTFIDWIHNAVTAAGIIFLFMMLYGALLCAKDALFWVAAFFWSFSKRLCAHARTEVGFIIDQYMSDPYTIDPFHKRMFHLACAYIIAAIYLSAFVIFSVMSAPFVFTFFVLKKVNGALVRLCR